MTAICSVHDCNLGSAMAGNSPVEQPTIKGGLWLALFNQQAVLCTWQSLQLAQCSGWFLADGWHREIMKGLLLHKLCFAEHVSGLWCCRAGMIVSWCCDQLP